MKSLQAVFERRLLRVCSLIHQSLHQLHTSKNSGDYEEAVTRNLLLLSIHPCGIKAQQGGSITYREMGWGRVESGGPEFMTSDASRWTRSVQDPLHTTGRKDALSAAGRAAPAWGTARFPGSGLATRHTPPRRLPSTYPRRRQQSLPTSSQSTWRY